MLVSVLSELLLQLNLDSQKILAEDYNANLFLEREDEALRYREYKDFNDGLKLVKLNLYSLYVRK